MYHRAFTKIEYKKMLRNYWRMMYGYNCVVRMRAITSSKGDHIGWVLKTTDIPLSAHDEHFLREHGLPVPGKFRCKMVTCNERRNKIWHV